MTPAARRLRRESCSVVSVLVGFAALTACAVTAEPPAPPRQATPVAQTGAARPAADAGALVIDHTCVDANDTVIPQAALDRARSLRILLGHNSVGWNVVNGLDALARKTPARYALPMVHQADQQRWWFNSHRGLGEFFCGRNGDPVGKMADFERRIPGVAELLDVASMKYCYADFTPRTDVQQAFDAYVGSMARVQQAYPKLKVVYWTCPMRVEATYGDKRNQFNQLLRTYVAQHGLVLYDLADLESHAPDGSETRDATGQAMYAGYSSDGGHLNAAGAERAAKAWWWLMARLAGWSGAGNNAAGEL